LGRFRTVAAVSSLIWQVVPGQTVAAIKKKTPQLSLRGPVQ